MSWRGISPVVPIIWTSGVQSSRVKGDNAVACEREVSLWKRTNKSTCQSQRDLEKFFKSNCVSSDIQFFSVSGPALSASASVSPLMLKSFSLSISTCHFKMRFFTCESSENKSNC
ncbi:hypothetical protein DL98DRAFT_169119 [Cadophora sp. DSE1049]|nr:hypothetical protein DL98DRAFT_169119 [Cadophora sp. DSE1049]